MVLSIQISTEDWNNYILKSIINSNNLTTQQSTNMLSQFINDIINNNINPSQYKNDISQIIQKLTSFGSELSLNNLLNLTIETTDQSIINRVILIDIINQFYKIDWINEIDKIIKYKDRKKLFNNHIKNKYNLLYQSSTIILPLKNIEDSYIKIANKSWDDNYINFIQSLLVDYWNWNWLSSNPNITMDMVLSYPKLPWNWHDLSTNPNITMDMVLSHPELPWNWFGLSSNPNITLDMILTNNMEDLNWYDLSENPNITLEMILSHPELYWDWEELSRNSMKTGKEKFIEEKVNELKVIDKFKLISKDDNLFPNVIANIIIEYLYFV
jgi:hypothetical protein